MNNLKNSLTSLTIISIIGQGAENIMSAKRTFWLSYDLGLKGDYSGLYTFLDSIQAKECGDSVAYFQKDFGDDFLNNLTKELKKAVKIKATDRIYVVYSDNNSSKIKGKFLFGSRKRAPWEGYAVQGTSVEEDF